MNQEILVDKIIPGIIGSIITLLGFIFKWVFDYYWLKTPKLNINAKIIPNGCEPPWNNYRKYNYNLEIEIQNHSKNEAYGFEVLKIIMPTNLNLASHKIISNNTHCVSDSNSVNIKGNCAITLPVNEKNTSFQAEDRINEFGNKIKIELAYKNNLGKSYRKTITGEFKKKTVIVNSIGVVSSKLLN